MSNKDFLKISTALKARRSLEALDTFDMLIVEEVVAGLEMIPAGAFKQVAQPHRTREHQFVLRADALVVSVTKKDDEVRIQHVKKLARVDR